MSLQHTISRIITKRPELKSLTPSEISRELAAELNANPETVRRILYKIGFPALEEQEVEVKGAPNPDRLYEYDEDSRVYRFNLPEDSFQASAEEVSLWVSWYSRSGSNLSRRETCKRIWKEHRRSMDEKTLTKVFSLLKITKRSPPLAPHSFQELGLEGAVENWQLLAESEVEAKFEKGERTHWRSLYEKESKKGYTLLKTIKDTIESFGEIPLPELPPTSRRVLQKAAAPSVPILLFSDWHVGMKDLEYNKEVLELRVHNLLQEVSEWLEIYRRPFDEFHIAIGGDILDGATELRSGHASQQDIHGAQQIAFAAELLASTILWIADAVSVPVHVHAVTGNHGRVAKGRNEDPNRLGESICYLFAEKLTPGVKWHIHEDIVAKWEVMSTTVFLTHGDRTPKDLDTLVRSHSVAPPAIVLSGHFHSFFCTQRGKVFTVRGGSLCGSTTFSRDMMGLSSVPSQILVEVREDGPRPAFYIPV